MVVLSKNYSMKKNILFIADSSLRNPILQSQGFPFLYNLNHSKYKPFVLSFEETNISKEESLEFQSIIKMYDSKINFLPVTISKKGIMPTLFNFIWKGSKILYSIVRKYDIKLLHARSFIPAFLSVIIKIIFKPSIKVVYDNRGLYIDEKILSGQIKKASIKEKFFRWFEKYAVKNCDRMVVVSNQFKSHLLNKRKNKTSSKIAVIPNRTLIDMNIDLTKKYSNKITLVYSGSHAIWQNSSELKELFFQALIIFDDVRFKVISYEQDNFQRLFSTENGLLKRINIFSVEPIKVKEELSKCNCGILLRENNLINNVSSPLKFAEYLAAGLPVLLSEGVGDTESIIIKYNVGVLIKNNNYITALKELRELLNDKDVYRRCLRIADKEFNINISFKQYQEIYDNL